jgi:hypothetical protein
VFLSMMPASIRPLVFVETAPRYTVVFIPFLSIGAGAAIATAMSRLQGDRTMLVCAWTALVFAAAINLWLPNYRYKPGSPPPIAKAVNDCIQNQGHLGFTEMVLPYDLWQAKVSEQFFDKKVRLLNADRPTTESPSQYGEIAELLKQNRTAAVFVPLGLEDDPTIKDLECRGEFRKTTVMLPGSSINVWLSVIGRGHADTPAAYLFLRK